MRYSLFLLLFFSLNVYATLYQSQDSQGNATYSDLPLPGSQEVSQPNSAMITKSNSAADVSLKKVTTENANHEYKTFSFITPQNQGTIQNQIDITVKLAVDPKLLAGDTIQLVLDGKPWGTPVASAEINMHLVERGMHQLSAEILDKNQAVIKQTDTITIYVHRASALFNPSGKQI